MAKIKYISSLSGSDELDIKALAKELEEEQSLNIEYNCTVYMIWWSDSNGGWYYEIYQGDINFTDTEQYEEDESIDGGLCTGSTKDAIEMMLQL